jgi:hypothetical protein
MISHASCKWIAGSCWRTWSSKLPSSCRISSASNYTIRQIRETTFRSDRPGAWPWSMAGRYWGCPSSGDPAGCRADYHGKTGGDSYTPANQFEAGCERLGEMSFLFSYKHGKRESLLRKMGRESLSYDLRMDRERVSGINQRWWLADWIIVWSKSYNL